MPGKTTFRTGHVKRRFRRRRFKRRMNRRRKIRMNRQMGTAFPKNQIVKLRYISNTTLDPANVNFVQHTFSANSIFDPDVTAAGHQPMGYDQWALFYNRYTVIGSKIWVQGITPGTDSVPSIYGVRTVDLTPTGHTTIEGLMETPTVSWRYLQTRTVGNVPDAAVARYSAKKWHNLANVKDNQERIGADFGGSPTKQTYFSLFYGRHASHTGTDLPQMDFAIKIEYIVLLSDPKELPQS